MSLVFASICKSKSWAKLSCGEHKCYFIASHNFLICYKKLQPHGVANVAKKYNDFISYQSEI